MMIGTLGPGGAERQAVLTLCGLAKRGFGPLALVALFLRSESQRFHLPRLEALGIPASELDRASGNGTNTSADRAMHAAQALPPALGEVTDYIRTIAARGPAIIHLWLDEINVKGGLAAVAAGVPKIIISMRSLPPTHFALHQPYMREGYRWLAQQPGVVMMNNSEAGARAYEYWLGLPLGEIQVLHNGFDFDDATLQACRAKRLDYRARHGIPADAPLLGTVIRLSEEKRPLLWANIAASVRRRIPRAHFLVVGDGPMRATFEARANRPDLLGALHAVGYERDAFAAIAAMDLFLLTSRAEGLPNVLVEAQALGVPIVTTDAGGARETVEHGRTGWVLDSDDTDFAGSVVARLLSDHAWRAKAGREAHDFVKSRFGLGRMIDETIVAYGGDPRTNDFPREAAFQESL